MVKNNFLYILLLCFCIFINACKKETPQTNISEAKTEVISTHTEIKYAEGFKITRLYK